MSGNTIKSVFLPGEGNPYLVDLASSLSKAGAIVERPYCGWFWLPAVLGGRRADIMHLHLLEVFLRPGNRLKAVAKLVVFLMQVLMVKMTGVRLVWTVHNIYDHEDERDVLHRISTVQIARRADAIIVHSAWAKDELIKMAHLSDAGKIFVIPHGNYFNSYKNSLSRAAARKEMGLDNTSLVFLFLGNIRRYKGVRELVDAFNKFDRMECELVIAGRSFDSSLETEIREKIKGSLKIRFYPGFVPDDQIQVYLNACNVVVLPFRGITTSGSAVLAMSFGRACIAPRLGGLAEVLNEKGAFLYDARDCAGLYRCLNEAFLRKAELDAMGAFNRQLVEQWGWDRIGNMTMDVYRRA